MTGKASLQDFLRQKKQEDERALGQIDWDKNKTDDLARVAELYAQVEGWLADSASEGVVQFARDSTELSDGTSY